MRKVMTEKPQTFLVTIAILEGRHYVWPNMDSAVVVKVDHKKRCTSVVNSSDNPFYNEYFVFEFFTGQENMMDRNITITVIQPRNMCRKRKILGYFTLDVATVWSQKNHQFYHKWAILSSPKSEAFVGPRGYIKVDVCILMKGQVSNIPFDVLNDEIEGNLLLPEGPSNDRQKALYVFDVFKCDYLVDRPGNTICDWMRLEPSKTFSVAPTVFLEISFSGLTVKTSSRKNSYSPTFNERLTIIDLFPPLCQRIKINICYGDCLRKYVYATKYLDLRLISNDKEEGFLPTFGPTFVHMYFEDNLDGYAGKILMSMSTQLEDIMHVVEPTKSGTEVQAITPIDEMTAFQYEEVILFAAIFEAAPISKKCCERTFCFRMTFGSVKGQRDLTASGDGPLINTTNLQKPKKISKNYYSLTFEDKPCMFLKDKVSCFRRRLYNSNILSRVVRELKIKLNHIEDIFENHHERLKSDDIDLLLLDALDYISTSGKKYMDIVNQYTTEYSTNLDKKKRETCLKEMSLIVNKSENVCSRRCKNTRCKLWKCQKILRRIEALIEDVQDCCPDIFIWMLSRSKRIACYRIPAREIFYSPIEEENGEFCGSIRTICFYLNQKDQTNLLCKMEIMLWLGLERHNDACLKGIPPGFRLQKELLETSRNLIADEKYGTTNIIKPIKKTRTSSSGTLSKQKIEYYSATKLFTVYWQILHYKDLQRLKAHIFQGKVTAGYDKSGLADAFIRVVITDKQNETRTISKSLNPLWDETLLFNNITLYGSKSHLKMNVCTVLVELLDKDTCGKTELIGRCLIKPKITLLGETDLPPLKLEWHKTYLNGESLGEILAAFELVEVSDYEKEMLPKEKIISIPPNIKPEMISYKVEVLFWGVRNLGKLCCIDINRPRISLNCGEETLYSDTIDNAKKHSNFPNQCKSIKVIIPTQKEYAPPLCLKIHDSRRFGIYAYAGVYVTNVSSFLIKPLTAEERNRNILESKTGSSGTLTSLCDNACENWKTDELKFELITCDQPELKKSKFDCITCLVRFIKKLTNHTNFKVTSQKSQSSMGTYEPLPQEESDTEDYDWWTKFYASLDDHQPRANTGKNVACQRNKLKIYQSELELQPDFSGFSDMLLNLEMYKGKRTGDEAVDEEHITAVFKGNVKIYPWSEEDVSDYVIPNGLPLKDGIFQCFPSNDSLNYVVRAYCVRAIGLRPKDLNGKSDPYLRLTLHNKVVSDVKNVITRQVNPIFGRCFEFNGVFPLDNTLKIAVWDYDITTADDLIGETKIDLENRFYTKYRAICGIADTYEESGYCAWRGQRKPTVILSDLCKRWRTETPVYEKTSVRIGSKEFVPVHFTPSGDTDFDNEVLALAALRRWKEMPVIGFTIVPEHVETRSLFNPTKPGIEQGKIQLWIDIFPIADLPPPKQVVICPRKPVAYELRVIVWNTDEVPLVEDDFFIGDKKSDIYVKGWLADRENPQYTDVHYKSLTGEGNFNWRFVFPFEYLSTENKLVIHRKESIFERDETEFKIPCKLNLQVWDNDTFSSDDFLGTLNLELAKMQRGARVAKKCDLHILETHAPTINLFKIRRTKGWWPFHGVDEKTGTMAMRGKIEIELEIVTAEEAEKSPAGLGRNEPQPLSPPKRPDVSFSWFKNPFRALKYVVCKLHKWKIIRALLCITLIAMILVGIHAFPEYTVKKFLGA